MLGLHPLFSCRDLSILWAHSLHAGSSLPEKFMSLPTVPRIRALYGLLACSIALNLAFILDEAFSSDSEDSEVSALAEEEREYEEALRAVRQRKGKAEQELASSREAYHAALLGQS